MSISYALFSCIGFNILSPIGLATKSANCNPAELLILFANITSNGKLMLS